MLLFVGPLCLAGADAVPVVVKSVGAPKPASGVTVTVICLSVAVELHVATLDVLPTDTEPFV